MILRNACTVCLKCAYICTYVRLINEAPAKTRYKTESKGHKGKETRSVKERIKRTCEGRGGEKEKQPYVSSFNGKYPSDRMNGE